MAGADYGTVRMMHKQLKAATGAQQIPDDACPHLGRNILDPKLAGERVIGPRQRRFIAKVNATEETHSSQRLGSTFKISLGKDVSFVYCGNVEVKSRVTQGEWHGSITGSQVDQSGSVHQ